MKLKLGGAGTVGSAAWWEPRVGKGFMAAIREASQFHLGARLWV